MTFLRIFGQWFDSNDANVEAVNEETAVSNHFLGVEGSDQTASILL
jgi:hypothetical protein